MQQGLAPGYIVRPHTSGGKVHFYRAELNRALLVLQISTDASGDGNKRIQATEPFVADYWTAYDSGGDLSAWRLHWQSKGGDSTDFLPPENHDEKVYPRANQLLTTAENLHKQMPLNLVFQKGDERKYVVSGGLASGTIELTFLIRRLVEVPEPEPGFVEVAAIV